MFYDKENTITGCKGREKTDCTSGILRGAGEERELKMSFWLAFKILFMKWIKFSYYINKQILFFGVFFRFVGQPRDMSWGQSAKQNKISVRIRERERKEDIQNVLMIFTQGINLPTTDCKKKVLKSHKVQLLG